MDTLIPNLAAPVRGNAAIYVSFIVVIDMCYLLYFTLGLFARMISAKTITVICTF